MALGSNLWCPRLHLNHMTKLPICSIELHQPIQGQNQPKKIFGEIGKFLDPPSSPEFPTPDTLYCSINFAAGGGGVQKFSDFVKKILVDFDPMELSWANGQLCHLMKVYTGTPQGQFQSMKFSYLSPVRKFYRCKNYDAVKIYTCTVLDLMDIVRQNISIPF